MSVVVTAGPQARPSSNRHTPCLPTYRLTAQALPGLELRSRSFSRRRGARGTSGAHHPEICREPMRTDEISTAGQAYTAGVGRGQRLARTRPALQAD